MVDNLPGDSVSDIAGSSTSGSKGAERTSMISQMLTDKLAYPLLIFARNQLIVISPYFSAGAGLMVNKLSSSSKSI